MKKVNIYVVRHGQTQYNLKNIVQGRCDSELTENGIFQAKCCGYGLRNIKFSSAYSSSLSRQYNTAEIILKENLYANNLKITKKEYLREIDFGTYDGKINTIMFAPIFDYLHLEYGDFKNLEKEMTFYDIAHFLQKTDDTMETYASVEKRMHDGIIEICNQANDEDNILLVTSGCSLDCLIYSLSQIKCPRLADNCSVSLIEYDNGNFNIKSFDDISYRQQGQQYYNAQEDH